MSTSEKSSGSADPSIRRRRGTRPGALAGPVGDGSDQAGPPTPLPSDPALGGTHDGFIQEVDALHDELASRVPRSEGRNAPGDSLPGSEVRPPAHSPAPSLGRTSPYLEERVRLMQSLAGRLEQDSRSLERQVGQLRRELREVDEELGNIAAELGFARSQGWGAEERLDEGDGAPWSEDGEPPVGPTGSAAARPVWSEEASVEPGLAAPTGSFSDFTLSRYNVTVQDLHDRRRALGWGTVALAAVISVALLYLTLRAHEPFPSMWLAFLPLVWMIPVPFFVAAFRGTHRVLRQHRLDLPEDS